MKNIRNFLHTTKDIFKIYWEIAPGLTLGLVSTNTLLSFQSVIYAYLFGVFIDQMLYIINDSKNLGDMVPVIAYFTVITLIVSILNRMNNYFASVITTIDVSKLKMKHAEFMVGLGISQMENSELTNKSTRFNEVYQSMSQQLSTIVQLIGSIIGIIALGIVVFPYVSVVVSLSIITFFIKFFNNGRYINKIWRLNRDYTEEQRNAWSSIGYLTEPSSLKEILLSNGTSLLRDKFEKFTSWKNNVYKNLRGKWATWEITHTIFDALIFAFGVYLISEQTIAGAVSVGSFIFILRSLSSFTDQLDTLSYRIARTTESSIRLQDALELFELYKPEKDGEKVLIKNGSTKSEAGPPEIQLSNVTFKYPNGKYPVIKDMNLTIKSGERVAIVGENGAGKTTLVKLLTRIYRPQKGKITLNDLDLNSIKKDNLHQNLGVLFQDFNQYGNLTVSENVQMGKVNKKMDKNKVDGALSKADALGFVQKYPKGIDQILSERFKKGIRPSGGQWQKIAIARFFYRNAPILIMDEPTASIDAVSESSIFDNIYKFMKGKTVIIISHRFSTVRNADRILVLDKGRIIEEGTHQELLAQDGKYAHAFKLQAKGYA